VSFPKYKKKKKHQYITANSLRNGLFANNRELHEILWGPSSNRVNYTSRGALSRIVSCF